MGWGGGGGGGEAREFVTFVVMLLLVAPNFFGKLDAIPICREVLVT